MSHGLEIVFKRLREAALDAAVDRFLSWCLPQDFAPDGGVSFKPPTDSVSWPTGTNLLTATQAREMLRRVLAADAAEIREATATVFSELLRQLDEACLVAQLCKDLNEARTQMLVDQAMASPTSLGKT